MGVTIKQKPKGVGPWYVYINHNGQRKAKCVGESRKTAEQVKQQIEARLALGDFGILARANSPVTIKEYAQKWLAEHVNVTLKRSSQITYAHLLRNYIVPQFGNLKIGALTRDQVHRWLLKLVAEGELSRDSLKVMLATLRSMLSQALDEGLIQENPATRQGKFTKSKKHGNKAQWMTRAERDRFLEACEEISPQLYPLFLTATHAGLRRGELCGLQVGDLQFGESDEDPNRFILVSRNYVCGSFSTPKSGKFRRVDMSRQLRKVLMDRRDTLLLRAMQAGKQLSPDTFVFGYPDGSPMSYSGSGLRDAMRATLERAGLRHFRFHDLRHTFASLLIQSGASLVYVQQQLGHSSIEVTQIYSHLIPGGNISCVDAMDSVMQQPRATQAQPFSEREREKLRQEIEAIKVTSSVPIPAKELLIILYDFSENS